MTTWKWISLVVILGVVAAVQGIITAYIVNKGGIK